MDRRGGDPGRLRSLFRLVTDEGIEYAMHSTEPRTLTKGSRILVRVVPSRLRIDCGPGKQVQLQALEPIG